MALSSSYDKLYTAQELIETALEDLQVTGAGKTPKSEDTTYCRKKLNMMLKNFSGGPNPLMPGLKMWQRKTGNITLTAAISFDIKTGGALSVNPPIDIETATRKTTDNIESTLKRMILQEYQEIRNKTTVGTPTKFYYERQYDTGKFYLNRIPSDITDVISLVYLQEIDDIDSNTNDIFVAKQWFEPLTYHLIARVASRFGRQLTQDQKDLIAATTMMANSFYPEDSRDFYRAKD